MRRNRWKHKAQIKVNFVNSSPIQTIVPPFICICVWYSWTLLFQNEKPWATINSYLQTAKKTPSGIPSKKSWTPGGSLKARTPLTWRGTAIKRIIVAHKWTSFGEATLLIKCFIFMGWGDGGGGGGGVEVCKCIPLQNPSTVYLVTSLRTTLFLGTLYEAYMKAFPILRSKRGSRKPRDKNAFVLGRRAYACGVAVGWRGSTFFLASCDLSRHHEKNAVLPCGHLHIWVSGYCTKWWTQGQCSYRVSIFVKRQDLAKKLDTWPDTRWWASSRHLPQHEFTQGKQSLRSWWHFISTYVYTDLTLPWRRTQTNGSDINLSRPHRCLTKYLASWNRSLLGVVSSVHTSGKICGWT